MNNGQKSIYKLYNIKYNIINFLSNNKWKLIIFIFIAIVSILTGILTAIKLSSSGSGVSLSDFSMIIFVDGNAHTISVMFSRFLSCLIMCALLLIFSYNYFLSIIGYLLLIYRGYLIGLNCAVLIIFCGFGGILNSILIIFPCQLIIMCMLGLLFCMMLSNFECKKKYGICQHSRIKQLLFFILLLFIICALETFMLLILRSTVILVI